MEWMANPSSHSTTTTWIDPETTSQTAAKRNDILEYRQVTSLPTLIPAYATACASSAAYASACSCWGITATVSTAPTPTVTVTSTLDTCEDL